MPDTVTLQAPRAYRQLSEAELELLNKINEHRELTRSLVAEVREFVVDRSAKSSVTPSALTPETDPVRAFAVARTELQTGFMWLSRSVAAPEFF